MPTSAAAKSASRESGYPWTAVAAGATVIAGFFGAQKLVGSAVRGRQPAWVEILGSELYYWYLLAAFLPVVVWLAGRVRIRRNGGLPAVALHSAAAVAIGVVHSVLYYAPLALLWGEPDAPVAGAVLRQLPTAVMTVFWKYWVLVGIYYAFDYHRKYRERQEHAAALERSLMEARLEALRMQLHPHFLFNTLHTVSMLNFEDPATANRVLSRLSELLRMALDGQGKQEVPLARELEFVRRYLEIEAIRFEDRLRVEFDVPVGLLDARVPNLILQPLVENAVKHGLAPRRTPGRIEVAARRSGDGLVLAVSDDGPGTRPSDRPPDRVPGAGSAGRDAVLPDTRGRGIGLENTRERLDTLYGAAGRLELESSGDGGFRAVVRLPYRTAPLDASEADA